jgi:hypothetical protein
MALGKVNTLEDIWENVIVKCLIALRSQSSVPGSAVTAAGLHYKIKCSSPTAPNGKSVQVHWLIRYTDVEEAGSLTCLDIWEYIE